MKVLFYLLSLIPISITAYIGINDGHTFLVIFSTFPYIITIYLVYISSHITAKVVSKTLTLFIVSVGLYFLLDTTYMERVLGYKFSFIFIPLWQYVMLLVGGFVIYLSNDSKD